jgi:hypothetical protein
MLWAGTVPPHESIPLLPQPTLAMLTIVLVLALLTLLVATEPEPRATHDSAEETPSPESS